MAKTKVPPPFYLTIMYSITKADDSFPGSSNILANSCQLYLPLSSPANQLNLQSGTLYAEGRDYRGKCYKSPIMFEEGRDLHIQLHSVTLGGRAVDVHKAAV